MRWAPLIDKALKFERQLDIVADNAKLDLRPSESIRQIEKAKECIAAARGHLVEAAKENKRK